MAFARHRISKLLGVAFVGAMLVVGVACSDDSGNEDGPTSTPTSTSTGTPEATATETPQTTGGGAAGGGIEPANPEEPPTGALVSEGGEVDLGLGTYCWSPPAGSGAFAGCADMIGIITGTEDLAVTAGEVLTVTGDLTWPPMTIAYAQLRPAPADTVVPAEGDFRAWSPEAEPTELEFEAGAPDEHTITLPADLEPGRYLLAVNYTAGEGRGSEATYGAILVVE
ncbi:MAG: hypothetical protein M0R75_00045 [Dehalococcoidia bacterium]|nr:hypothetical protein [Dehalococcoidia bacterium]